MICTRDALCAARQHHHILHLDVLRRGVERMVMFRARAAAVGGRAYACTV